MHELTKMASRNTGSEYRKKSRDNDRYWGYLFIAPVILGSICFMFFPAIFSMFISFWRWDFITTPKFVGLGNYIMIFSDPFTITILKNTLYYMLLTVPVTLVTSTGMALLLYINTVGRQVFRVIYFMPCVTGTVAVALAWTWIFNADFGLLNGIIYKLTGLAGPNWLGNPNFSMIVIATAAIWRATGYQAVIVLAGLNNIPASYREAAKIDGATPFQTFFRIILPLLTPSLFFVSTMLLVTAVQIFNEPYIITRGGPANSTMTLMLHIYNTAFVYFRFGKTSVYSLILFIISITITIFHFRGQKRWVVYDVE